ncbi:pro-sigmaK processing inhibitor BofA family protein [Domibacillus epiphyticus]|uniref:Pro-sigmaK processing inhibitor BofA n=1 Tax=Domibacillus epiphyticus TaxID=1714355 RepID=A0A1V2A6Z6_9BACI|nr:pro-sigmaK processing inhibitor BofA family protein [Domibacillus epiphyticus]OMP66771.1 hypothetical protein BTO28_10455 [Domibacillus epiphyticus]
MRKIAYLAALTIKKIIIGAFFLYIVNIMINNVGMHISMNITTSLIAGFLGLPGILMLAAIHLFIFN